MKIWMMSMIALTAFIATSASASPVGVENQYVAAGTPVSVPGECSSAPPAVHVGGACFIVPSSADEVWIDIHDRAHDTPGGTITFQTSSGTNLSPQVHFCTDFIRRDLPDETARIVIEFWGPQDGQDPTCIATSGTIQIDFL